MPSSDIRRLLTTTQFSVHQSDSASSALSVTDLEKTYANGRVALKGISFTVREGDFYALLGRNGAGKSTTIGITCSLVAKTAGKVHIFGIDIDQDIGLAKSHLGLVPQEINFNQFETPWNILINHAGYYGVPRATACQQAEKFLTKLDLWDHRNAISRRLSGGMKRKLMVARALMHEPRLLILDEPTAGIDFEFRLSMWDFLKDLNKQGVTIILTTHYLEEAEKLCRNVGIIELGEMILDVDMKSLFKQLNQETYVLDLSQSVEEWNLPAEYGSAMRLVDATTIEVDINRKDSINSVFKSLTEQDIHVISIQTKSNRLETLFMELLRKEAGECQRWQMK